MKSGGYGFLLQTLSDRAAEASTSSLADLGVLGVIGVLTTLLTKVLVAIIAIFKCSACCHAMPVPRNAIEFKTANQATKRKKTGTVHVCTELTRKEHQCLADSDALPVLTCGVPICIRQMSSLASKCSSQVSSRESTCQSGVGKNTRFPGQNTSAKFEPIRKFEMLPIRQLTCWKDSLERKTRLPRPDCCAS